MYSVHSMSFDLFISHILCVTLSKSTINNAMRKSVRRARLKYGESLKEQQKKKVTTEKELKRKVIGEEITGSKEKKVLESSISDLSKKRCRCLCFGCW